jgi:hypothetical protein
MSLLQFQSSPNKGAVASGLDNSPGEFIWGTEGIGAVIGRTNRRTHRLLTQGAIKSPKKVGGRWVASRAALLRELGGAS